MQFLLFVPTDVTLVTHGHKNSVTHIISSNVGAQCPRHVHLYMLHCSSAHFIPLNSREMFSKKDKMYQ